MTAIASRLPSVMCGSPRLGRRVRDDAVGDRLEGVGRRTRAGEQLAVDEERRRAAYLQLVPFLTAELDARRIAARSHATVVALHVESDRLGEVMEEARRIHSRLRPFMMREQLVVH